MMLLDSSNIGNPPTAGKGTNLCMMVLVAGLSLLAFLIRTFSPTFQTQEIETRENISFKYPETKRKAEDAKLTHSYRNSTGNSSYITLKKLGRWCRLKGDKKNNKKFHAIFVSSWQINRVLTLVALRLA